MASGGSNSRPISHPSGRLISYAYAFHRRDSDHAHLSAGVVEVLPTCALRHSPRCFRRGTRVRMNLNVTAKPVNYALRIRLSDWTRRRSETRASPPRRRAGRASSRSGSPRCALSGSPRITLTQQTPEKRPLAMRVLVSSGFSQNLRYQDDEIKRFRPPRRRAGRGRAAFPQSRPVHVFIFPLLVGIWWAEVARRGSGCVAEARRGRAPHTCYCFPGRS